MSQHPLSPRLYAVLHELAVRQMRSESGARTLQPTALVHEAWLRLAAGRPPTDTAGFRAAAAAAMRHVRIDAARQRRAACRDRARQVAWTEACEGADRARDAYVLALDAALDRLAVQLPELARLVELRYFLGLEAEAAARELGWSLRTVKRRWQLARGWLHREVQRELAGG
jgi:RNA polymerase sigma factor (TIGR02999 family)